ncbi:MAG TPA: Rid family hydrolase [Phycisphaerae bacterium]|nr:Rid family hydrolase [Phycisphaerae bacterium]HRR83396.1 Rid family hydrolase [Phycisphaerae bacterium]
MDFYAHHCGIPSVSVNISRFRGPSGVDEYHLVVTPTKYGSVNAQLEWVAHAYHKTLESIGLDARTAVLRRFFCSDLHNQAEALDACPISRCGNADDPCAISRVGQPPGPPAKVILWAYHVRDRGNELEKSLRGAHLTLRRGDLSHHWTTGLTCTTGHGSYGQTRGIFDRYNALLCEQGMTLADHVMRTWLFVRDIDANYQGLVAARREFFAEHGLTADTHFIASSGIGGSSADPAAIVTLDAYAISGVRPEQIRFLAAPDHLSPTYVYGVTFERGTSVAYRDRKHVIISGTASIDHQGKILYPGDVSRQLDRTLENIEALLDHAGATVNDMSAFIVYIRDPSDHMIAQQQMRDRFGHAPIAVLVAPVCRPGWLIEVEGTAVVPETNPELLPF